MRIGFNKLHFTGRELDYIRDAAERSRLSGDGHFTRTCQALFEKKYGFGQCLLTSSCTDALEMAALLMNIEAGDEVIMPSYTFVSTANAFVLRGAVIRFADSCASHPNIDADQLEQLITPKTKAIVVVHYAGVACDMDRIMGLAKKHGLLVLEDAAHAIDSYYKDRPLGSIGDLGAFSFHETKNIIAGEAGMLTVNNPAFRSRAEVIREKGTNRSAFFRGEVQKYEWVDIGSSFLPSEIIAAILLAQAEEIDSIQQRRRETWKKYHAAFEALEQEGFITRPFLPGFAGSNGHLYYLLCRSAEERNALIDHLDAKGIQALFHYQPLHSSPFYKDRHDGRALPHCDRFAATLLRLPFFYSLDDEQLARIAGAVESFYRS